MKFLYHKKKMLYSTYPSIIFDDNVSSTINKEFHCTPLAFFNCNVQGSSLNKTWRQIESGKMLMYVIDKLCIADY